MTGYKSDGGTEDSMLSVLLDLRFCRQNGLQVNPQSLLNGKFKRQENLEASAKEIWQSVFPRKASKLILYLPVPQSDTGSQVEKTKANE